MKLTTDEIIEEIEAIIDKKIEYSSYYGDMHKVKIGKLVEKVCQKAQRVIGTKELLSIGGYSPLVLDFKKNEMNPSWQIDLWDLFLDDNGNITFDKVLNKIILLEKPRQAGYTYTMAKIFVVCALLKRETKFAIGTQTKTMIEDIISPKMAETLPFQRIDRKDRNEILRSFGFSTMELSYNAKDMEYKFPNEGFLKLIGIDTMKNRNRGASDYNGYALDEAAYIENVDIIDNVLAPWLNTRQGFAIYGSTHNGKSWFYNYCQNAKESDDPRYIHLSYDLFTCGLYSEERCREILKNQYDDRRLKDPTKTPREICLGLAQEYFVYANESTSKKKLWYHYSKNPSMYVFDQKEPAIIDNQIIDITKDPMFTHYVAIDYGLTLDPSAAIFGAVSQYGHIVVYDEIYYEEGGIREFVELIKTKEMEWGVEPEEYYIDRSAKTARARPTKDSIHTHMDDFATAGIDPVPVKYMRKPARIAHAAEFFILRTGTHDLYGDRKYCPKIYISNKCSQLLSEMDTLEITVSGDKVTTNFSKLGNDHCTDALLYLLSGVDTSLEVDIQELDSVSKVPMHLQIKDGLSNNKLKGNFSTPRNYSKGNSSITSFT